MGGAQYSKSGRSLGAEREHTATVGEKKENKAFGECDKRLDDKPIWNLRHDKFQEIQAVYFRKSKRLNCEMRPMAASVALVAVSELTRRLAAPATSAAARVFSCWLSCSLAAPR